MVINIKKSKFYQNKTFIKWCKLSSLTLILGTSIILNTIYLPKYFNNPQQQITTAISIEATDKTSQEKNILPLTNYVTTFNTLGDLLGACPNIFAFHSNVSKFGRFLIGINNKEADTTKEYWRILYFTDGNNWKVTPKGVDGTILQNNDRFRFELVKWK